MYQLINGSMKLIVYDKKDADMYVKNGWKLIEKKGKSKKIKKNEFGNLIGTKTIDENSIPSDIF